MKEFVSRNSDQREKRREALGKSRAPFYCVNVNRTSLDHLLLGENADVDKVSHAGSIRSKKRPNKRFVSLCAWNVAATWPSGLTQSLRAD
jgi:hypothetical protein